MQKPSMVSSTEKTVLLFYGLGALAVALIFFAVGPLVNLASAASWGSDSSPQIAVLCAQNGSQASLCQSLQQGVSRVIDTNASGLQVSMSFYDTGATPDGAAAAASAAARNPNTAVIIGPLNAPQVLAAAEVAQEYSLVVITPASTAASLDASQFHNLYRIPALDVHQGQALADFLMNRLRVSDIYVVAESSANAQGLLDEFNSMAQNHLRVVGSLQLQDKSQAANLGSQIKSSQAQAVLFLGSAPTASSVLQELHSAGLQIPFIGNDTINFEGLYPLPAGSGPVFYTTPFFELNASSVPGGDQQLPLFSVLKNQPFGYENLMAAELSLAVLRQNSSLFTSARQGFYKNLLQNNAGSSGFVAGQLTPQKIHIFQVDPQAQDGSRNQLIYSLPVK